MHGTASGLRLVFAKRKVVVLFNGMKSQCRVLDSVRWSLPSLLFFSPTVDLVASSSQRSRSRPLASNTQVFRDHIVRKLLVQVYGNPKDDQWLAATAEAMRPCRLLTAMPSAQWIRVTEINGCVEIIRRDVGPGKDG